MTKYMLKYKNLAAQYGYYTDMKQIIDHSHCSPTVVPFKDKNENSQSYYLLFITHYYIV